MKKKFSLIVFVFLVFNFSRLFSNIVYAVSIPTLNISTEAIYDEMGSFSEGLIWVKSGKDFKYIDENGKVIIKDLHFEDFSEITSVGDFHNGLAFVMGSKTGDQLFINKSGKKVFKLLKGISTSADFHSNITIGFNQESGVVFVGDNKGSAKKYRNNWLVLPPYTEGSLRYYDYINETVVSGFLDINQKITIKAQFDDVTPFNQGMSFASKKNKYGIINTNGDFIVTPQFDDFSILDSYDYRIFNNGIASVSKNGKYGFIDTKGNIVSDFVWDHSIMFTENLGSVVLNGKIGFVNIKGETVLPPKYDDANPFKNGFSLVSNDFIYRFIDTKGNFVSDESWNFESTVSLYNNSDNISYLKNEKWGLAKISYQDGKSKASKSNTKLIYNENEIKFENDVLNRNGTTYYPFRELLNALGAKVEWIDYQKKAIGFLDDKTIQFIIGSKNYILNRKSILLEDGVSAFVKNGVTYIPFRVCAEGLGFDVFWDENTNSIRLKKNSETKSDK